MPALLDRVEKKAEELLDRARPPQPRKMPDEDKRMLKRGRERLEQIAPRRREGIEFANNNHYVSIDKSGLKLVEQSTVPQWAGGDKPDHRVRRSHDLIGPILQRKVSAATGRIPGYEVVPSTYDPEDYSATRLSRKILVAGYDGPWELKRAFRKFVWNALVTEEAFIMPYWDPNVGPFTKVEGDDGQVRYVGAGELRAAVYSGLEVIWEPGIDFEDSPWFGIEHARPRRQLEAEPDFLGPKLKADADEHASISGRERPRGGDLVLVTEIFERPCPKYPKGRRCFYANGREIFAREDYPLLDHEGEVVDRTCLHRASYRIDGSSDRGRGLVQSLIETMRQYDYGANKAAEYLQLVLVPQLMALEGQVKGTIDDEPGSVVELDPEMAGEFEPKWREMPSMPREFNDLQDRAHAELGFISHDNEIPSQVESGKGIGELRQKDLTAWEDFVMELEAVHAAFGRDALCIVQHRYTEERMLQFRGSTGWETLSDFRGADIRGQTDVKVLRGSLEGRSRAAAEQQIMQLAGPTGLFPGRFPPEVVMRALTMGDPEILNEAYEEDEARVNFIISQIRAGGTKALDAMGDRPVFPGEEAPMLDETGEIIWIEPPVEPELDPETGEPIPGTGSEGRPRMETSLPGWLPRPFDNIAVHKLRIENFMKSDEWSHLGGDTQQATMDYYRALIDLETRNADRQRELQTQRAEELGMNNAARPQGAKPLPDQPSPETGGGQEAAPPAE